MSQRVTGFVAPFMCIVLMLLLGTLLFGDIFSIQNTSKVDAYRVPVSTGVDLLGYAWSDNFGWISFNCENDPNSCTYTHQNGVTINNPWGVAIATTSGDITGYAWSPNVGWIDFDNPDVTACGAGAMAVSYDVVNKKMVGFARVVSLVGVDTGMAGGADGCINLNPGGVVPPTHAVQLKTYTNGATKIDYFDGYAWDASMPGGAAPASGVGWIDFCGWTNQMGSLIALPAGMTDMDAYNSCVHTSVPIEVLAPTPPTLFVDCTPATNCANVPDNGSVEVSWNGTSVDPNANCRVVSGAGAFSDPIGVFGFIPTGVLTGPNIYSFQISCSNNNGGPFIPSSLVQVTVLPPAPGPLVCRDGIDNEAHPDGKVDFDGGASVGLSPLRQADPGCSSAYDTTEEDIFGTFSIDPIRARPGDTVDVSWNVTGASSCTLKRFRRNVVMATMAIACNPTACYGEFPDQVVDKDKNVFTLECAGPGGTVLSRSVRVLVEGGIMPY